MGIALAALAALNINIGSSFNIGKIGGLVIFALLLASLAYVCVNTKKK